ncbi:MAG: tetratricopeptide repeat-containing protein, partial [Gemmataceae bacterium]|nr:tetratricopeptide repeat-containing protein [Gemmataceae bacterium]
RAESLHRRALVGREKVLGPDHPDTLASVNDLGLLYRDKGEYGRAEPLLVQALAGRETVLGKHHPATLASVNNLATLYQDMGDLRRAEPLHRRALEGFEKAHGADHPLTLTSAGNLGRLLTETDRPAEAVPLLERVYAERTHPLHWVGAGIQLIKAYARVGRPADAARVVGEVLAEGRRRVKPASPEFGGMLAKSGNWLLDLDPAAAEPVLRECLELREKLDPKAWTTANTRSLLGDALLRQGKPAEAEPLLVAGYAGLLADRSNIPPPAANNLPEAADRLVDLYVALGKPDEAKRWRAERAKYPFVAPPPRPAHRP